ncbi:hypothetical protein ACFY1L_46820 [Streptomyces sp. NPDC001663]|uniref:hypothetical protein n=1 Tax=Streptomyces sp. NPDC001663 TaxID=3364597 RepID=UPI0036772262
MLSGGPGRLADVVGTGWRFFESAGLLDLEYLHSQFSLARAFTLISLGEDYLEPPRRRSGSKQITWAETTCPAASDFRTKPGPSLYLTLLPHLGAATPKELNGSCLCDTGQVCVAQAYCGGVGEPHLAANRARSVSGPP